MLLGVFMYTVAVNVFIVPAGFYSGGFMGFAQLIRVLLETVMHLDFGGFNITSVIYYLLNIPGFLLARKYFGRLYIAKTIFGISVMTILLAVIPVVRPPVMGDDVLASALVGGILGGAGIGLVLRSGASDGGMDIISVLLLHWRKDLSVGRINLATNIVLYSIMLAMFDWHVVIYSLIASAVTSFAVDHVYSQNINMEVHVMTRGDISALEQKLMQELGRGVTRWQAVGAYSGDDIHILYVIVNKFEVRKLRSIVYEYDPQAFIVANTGVGVTGNYAQHLA